MDKSFTGVVEGFSFLTRGSRHPAKLLPEGGSLNRRYESEKVGKKKTRPYLLTITPLGGAS